MPESKQQGKAVKNFEEYLFRTGYSKTVIPIYCRRLKDFLNATKSSCVTSKGVVNLKEDILTYLGSRPFDYRKWTTEAALHTFYYSVTGEYFRKRLKQGRRIEPIEKEIEKFGVYLSKARRLGKETVHSSCNTVKIYLYSIFYKKRNYFYKDLTFQQTQRYLLQTISHVSPSSKKAMLVQIRAFFNYIEFEYGERSMELFGLPLIALVKKISSMPKYLTNEETILLLDAYDKDTSAGIRDYAIARCFSDLALRCSEIAKLTVDDFNWADGALTVKSTKPRSERTLPFNMATGEAIESYLAGTRPLTKERVLFVRFKRE
jgi:site-specific recombinase XerD